MYCAPHRSYSYVYGAHVCASRICHILQPIVTQTTYGFKNQIKITDKKNHQ